MHSFACEYSFVLTPFVEETGLSLWNCLLKDQLHVIHEFILGLLVLFH